MRVLTRAFLRGLAVVLPIVLTIYVIGWLVMLIETAVARPIKRTFGEDAYLDGMGAVVGLLLILLIGLLTYSGLFRRLVANVSRVFGRIPLVKSLYGGLRDLTEFVSRAHSHDQVSHVVLLRVKPELHLLGFVTREDFETLPEEFGADEDEQVAVYLPMSYQIGGFTVFVPRSAIEPVSMSVEDAMRFSITAGMSLKTQPGDLLDKLFEDDPSGESPGDEEKSRRNDGQSPAPAPRENAEEPT